MSRTHIWSLIDSFNTPQPFLTWSLLLQEYGVTSFLIPMHIMKMIVITQSQLDDILPTLASFVTFFLWGWVGEIKTGSGDVIHNPPSLTQHRITLNDDCTMVVLLSKPQAYHTLTKGILIFGSHPLAFVSFRFASMRFGSLCCAVVVCVLFSVGLVLI